MEHVLGIQSPGTWLTTHTAWFHLLLPQRCPTFTSLHSQLTAIPTPLRERPQPPHTDLLLAVSLLREGNSLPRNCSCASRLWFIRAYSACLPGQLGKAWWMGRRLCVCVLSFTAIGSQLKQYLSLGETLSLKIDFTLKVPGLIVETLIR